MWLKGKVISTDGTMVGIDLGTRLLKVNITKLRKDETRSPSKPGLDLPSSDDDLHKDLMSQASAADRPAKKRILKKTAVAEPDSVDSEPSSSTGLFTEDHTCEQQNANWNCVTKGKIHVLEVFAGSARLSQCCALTGLKVGTPIDIRTGFDIMTSKGRQMVLDIIREQQPDVVWLGSVCGPWSIMQNINDPKVVAEKRAKYLPMIDFVSSIARYQLSRGLYFIIENPQKSKIWTLKSIVELMNREQVTWNDLDFCAFGLRDPDTKLRSLKPTSLMHNLPPEVMRPIFRRCSNYTKKEKHQHQPLEGNTKSQGSRTRLAQIYPYSFCHEMAHILLRFLKAKPLDNEVFLLEDIFEPFSDSDISHIKPRWTG